ncbi:MAG: hypothetical protein AAF614_05985 [Chloroflexota bacterium]
MNDKAYTQLIEGIISLPDADTATAQAWSVQQMLQQPACYRVMRELLRAAYKAGDEQRYRAIDNLLAYVLALESTETPDRKGLPPLVVTTTDVPASSEASYDRWLKQLNLEMSDNLQDEPIFASDQQSTLPDRQKYEIFKTIRKRHRSLQANLMRGRVKTAVTADLRFLINRLDRLIAITPAKSLVHLLANPQEEQAALHNSLATAHLNLNQRDEARETLRQAAARWRALGNVDKAKAADGQRERLGNLQGYQVDDELSRLQARLLGQKREPLPAIGTLIQMGELQLENGNSYEGQRLFRQALTRLKELGYSEEMVSGADFGLTMMETVQGDTPGTISLSPAAMQAILTTAVSSTDHAESIQHREDSLTKIELFLYVRAFFRRCHAGLATAFALDGNREAAAKHRQIEKDLDSEAMNNAFSQAALAELDNLFK